MKPHPLQQVTFILSLVFSVVYLGLGIAILAEIIPLAWLERWATILFGAGLILYAGVRLYRSYLIYKEATEE